MTKSLIAKAKKLLAEERITFPLEEEHFSPRRKGRLSIALAYPQRYYTAMSNLGFQTVYRLFNEQPETVCERVFLPDPEDLEEYRRTETPLFSLETQRPVNSFDILAFSISYENDYPHLLRMMELARIPLVKKERRENHPLVLAGGATILMNPEPLADFVDFFIIGEAEAVLAQLAEVLRRSKGEKKNKDELLTELISIDGVYVPQFYSWRYHQDGTIASFLPQEGIPGQVKRIWLKNLNESLTCSSLVTPHTELSRMFLMELSRGCSRRCRFCASCYAYFPHRARDGPLLKEVVRKTTWPAEKIGLVGAAISDYPGLLGLGHEILHSQSSLSFSSLRVDSLTPALADLIHDSEQRTITLAPEAGSERLRRVIHKGFTEEDILQAVEILSGRGVRSFRLYFMVGLPWEKSEDIRGIVELTKKIRHHLREKSRGKKGAEKIILSLNSFVPKPATPFQWHPLAEVSTLKEKVETIKRGLRRERGVTVAADIPKWAYLQTLLARGDRRVGRLLMAAHQLGGNWPQVYRSVDLNPDFYIYRPRPFTEILPWDFIDHGIKKEVLWAEYQASRDEAESPS